jgi:hypothetical protein
MFSKLRTTFQRQFSLLFYFGIPFAIVDSLSLFEFYRNISYKIKYIIFKLIKNVKSPPLYYYSLLSKHRRPDQIIALWGFYDTRQTNVMAN